MAIFTAKLEEYKVTSEKKKNVHYAKFTLILHSNSVPGKVYLRRYISIPKDADILYVFNVRDGGAVCYQTLLTQLSCFIPFLW